MCESGRLEYIARQLITHVVCYSLDAMLVQPSATGSKLLCGQFAFNARAVLTGDDDGSVAVYGLHGFEQHPNDQVTLCGILNCNSCLRCYASYKYRVQQSHFTDGSI